MKNKILLLISIFLLLITINYASANKISIREDANARDYNFGLGTGSRAEYVLQMAQSFTTPATSINVTSIKYCVDELNLGTENYPISINITGPMATNSSAPDVTVAAYGWNTSISLSAKGCINLTMKQVVSGSQTVILNASTTYFLVYHTVANQSVNKALWTNVSGGTEYADGKGYYSYTPGQWFTPASRDVSSIVWYDTYTPPSGCVAGADCIVDCTTNPVITTSVSSPGYTVTFRGAGRVKLKAVYDYDKRIIEGGCQVGIIGGALQ